MQARKPSKLTEEAIRLYDDCDQRSFDDIYGKDHVFEEVDDLIEPKFKRLFEETYQVCNVQNNKCLREEHLSEKTEHLQEEAPNYDNASSKDTPRPSGDGVSNAHNPALSKGPTSQVNQSGARQDSNRKLGSEPPMGHGAGPKKRQQESVEKTIVRIPWIAFFDRSDGETADDYFNSGRFSYMKVEDVNDGFAFGYITDANGDPDAEDGEEVYEIEVEHIREGQRRHKNSKLGAGPKKRQQESVDMTKIFEQVYVDTQLQEAGLYEKEKQIKESIDMTEQLKEDEPKKTDLVQQFLREQEEA